MPYPHEPSFPFRLQLFLVLLVGSLTGFALAAHGSIRQRLFGTAFLGAGVLFSYAVMRLFVELLCRPLASKHTGIVRLWSLVWFYGPVPFSMLLFLMFSDQPQPGLPAGAFLSVLLALAAGWSAGAVPALRLGERHRYPGR